MEPPTPSPPHPHRRTFRRPHRRPAPATTPHRWCRGPTGREPAVTPPRCGPGWTRSAEVVPPVRMRTADTTTSDHPPRPPGKIGGSGATRAQVHPRHHYQRSPVPNTLPSNTMPLRTRRLPACRFAASSQAPSACHNAAPGLITSAPGVLTVLTDAGITPVPVWCSAGLGEVERGLTGVRRQHPHLQPNHNSGQPNRKRRLWRRVDGARQGVCRLQCVDH